MTRKPSVCITSITLKPETFCLYNQYQAQAQTQQTVLFP